MVDPGNMVPGLLSSCRLSLRENQLIRMNVVEFSRADAPYGLHYLFVTCDILKLVSFRGHHKLFVHVIMFMYKRIRYTAIADR